MPKSPESTLEQRVETEIARLSPIRDNLRIQFNVVDNELALLTELLHPHEPKPPEETQGQTTESGKI